VDHVGEGLVSGGKSIFNGIFTGITGLVKEPIKGAEKEGLGGFLKGGLKGITGLIVKPISGVIDATSKTAEGIKNTTKVFSKETRELRTRRYSPRPFYGYSR
jgi:vacuolar protein sorting-associated protein 13A/C